MSGLGAAIAEKNLEKGRTEGRLEGHREGRQEGRQEGHREGRQEGRQEGQIIVFKNMIRRGFSVKDAMSIAEITEEQANQALKELDKKE